MRAFHTYSGEVKDFSTKLFKCLLFLNLVLTSDSYSLAQEQSRKACIESFDRKAWDTAFRECKLATENSETHYPGLTEYNLGYLYLFGYGTIQNYDLALKWLLRAANIGQERAQLLLANVYDHGLGVPPDYVKAYVYYCLAVLHGFKDAQKDRDRVASRLTPERLQLAQRLASRIWERGEAEREAWLFGRAKYAIENPSEIPEGIMISDIQVALKRLGYYTGQADGIWGTQTNDAINRYKAAKNLKSDTDIAKIYRILTEESGERERRNELFNSAMAHLNEVIAKDNKSSDGLLLITSGTGIVVSEHGHILTASHLVNQCSAIKVSFHDKNSTEAKIVSVDKANDLALLDSPCQTSFYASFRDGPPLRIGEPVAAIGYPLQGLLSSSASITTGTISSLSGPGNDIRFLQITAPIQLGNSGGPLLDSAGNLIGVIVGKLDAKKILRSTGDIPQNVNFGVNANLASLFLQASGIKHSRAKFDEHLEFSDVAEKATKFTVLIECWGTQ